MHFSCNFGQRRQGKLCYTFSQFKNFWVLITSLITCKREGRKTHSICSSFELLADESRDSSQAEKNINVVKAEQTHKMTIIFNQNGQKLSFRVKIVILWICSALTTVIFFSALDNLRDSSANGSKLEQMEWAKSKKAPGLLKMHARRGKLFRFSILAVYISISNYWVVWIKKESDALAFILGFLVGQKNKVRLFWEGHKN